MDVTGYRSSGELSDITVVVDGEQFHLHKFPLFVRSNYFKNLTGLQTDGTTAGSSSSSSASTTGNASRVELKDFPGGARTFATVADYCYNKEVRVDAANVVPVRCAAEYLEMGGTSSSSINTTSTGSGSSVVGRGGLATLADNVLFDVTYAAKSKRDSHAVLVLLEQAAAYAPLADRCGMSGKLIEAFVESLAGSVRATAASSAYGSGAGTVYDNAVHRMALGDDQLAVLCALPLKWMNDLVKTTATSRHALNHGLLAYIVQNYIDSNTAISGVDASKIRRNSKPASHSATDSAAVSPKPRNLIAMAADILKVDMAVASGGAQPATPATSSSSSSSSSAAAASAVVAAVEALETKPTVAKAAPEANVEATSDAGQRKDHLVSMAAEILNEQPRSNNLIDIVSEIKSEEKPANLIGIAGQILGAEPASSSPVKATEPTSTTTGEHLVGIVGEILAHNESAQSVGNNKNNNTSHLKAIAGDILTAAPAASTTSASSNTTDPLVTNRHSEAAPKAMTTTPPKTTLSDADKLRLIDTLARTLSELNVQPQFGVAWLLVYMNALHKLNAEPTLMSIFHHWLWDALQHHHGESAPSSSDGVTDELSGVPAPLIVQLVHDIAADNTKENSKLVGLVDRYIADLQAHDKLDAANFSSLAACIPREKRSSFDTLASALVYLLKKEPKSINAAQQKELLAAVDLHKLSEQSLAECAKCDLIPSSLVTEAALALCAKLRQQLQDVQAVVRAHERLSQHPQPHHSVSATSTRPLRAEPSFIGSSSSRMLLSDAYATLSSAPYASTSVKFSSMHSPPPPPLHSHRSSASSSVRHRSSEPRSSGRTGDHYIIPIHMTTKTHNSGLASAGGVDGVGVSAYTSSIAPRSTALTKSAYARPATSVLNSSYKAASFNPSSLQPAPLSVRHHHQHFLPHRAAMHDCMADKFEERAGAAANCLDDADLYDYFSSSSSYTYSTMY